MTDVGRAIRVILAHGASGDAERMRPHVDGLVARGFEAHAIDLPRRKAEAAVPAWRDAIARLQPPADGGARLAIGGQSFGGRVASLLLAEEPTRADALVLLSYPLHAPGKAATWEGRAGHLPAILVPALFLSGEADPLARLDLLHEAARRVPNATLHTWPDEGHWLGPVLDDVLDVMAAWLRERLG